MLKRRQRAKEDRQFWKPLGRFERRLRMARRYNLDGMMNPLGGIETPFGTDDAWTPRRLFANNEVGGWFDPSDLSSMFQDSAGTTAVTGVEQPVGLHLDKSKGLALGAELIGSYLTAGYWSVNVTGVAFPGSSVNFDATSDRCSAPSPFTSGKTYKCTVTLSATGGGTVQFDDDGVGGGPGSLTSYKSSIGATTTFYFRATSSNRFRFIQDSGSGTVSITGFSIKEISGNHRYQSTSAARPTLSARYNLFTKTDALDHSDWIKVSSPTITPNVATDPYGATTVDKFITGNGQAASYVNQTPTLPLGVCIVSGWAKAGEHTELHVERNGGVRSKFNLSTGAVTSNAGGAVGTIVADAQGLYRWTMTWTEATGGAVNIYVGQSLTTGDGTSGLYIWGLDIRPANDGVGLPAYQRVNTSTDYDTSGFPMYLKYDGTDDFMETAAVDFSGTDKMSVFSGARKASASPLMLVELGTAFASVAGSWFLLPGVDTGADGWNTVSRGTAAASAGQASVFSAAGTRTDVISAMHDIAGDLTTLRVNGVAATNATGDKGAGNFANAKLYFGMRAGASLPFNGREYQTIIRGAASTAAEIANAEAYVNARTKAY